MGCGGIQHSVRCEGLPRGTLRGTLWVRDTLWSWKTSQKTHCGVWTPQGAHCKREGLIALAEIRAQQEPDLQGKGSSRQGLSAGAGPYLQEGEGCPLELLCALRTLDEAHKTGLPDLQHEERGGDALWGTHTNPPSAGLAAKHIPQHSQTLQHSCRGVDGLLLLPWTRTSTGKAHGMDLWPSPTAPGCLSRTQCHFCTCILFTIISCSTSGWVSPVRFMVPSSSTTACTVGKPVLFSCSEWTESMVGMLGEEDSPGSLEPCRDKFLLLRSHSHSPAKPLTFAALGQDTGTPVSGSSEAQPSPQALGATPGESRAGTACPDRTLSFRVTR